MRLPAPACLLLSACLASAAPAEQAPAPAATPVAPGDAAAGAAPAPELSPEFAHQAAVRDLLKLQGAFSTMNSWFLEARAGFEASTPDIPADLLDNVWQESLASAGLAAREQALIDACAATMSPQEAQASLAFLRGPAMTLVNQLMRGSHDGVQTAASAFMREVATNCCEPSPTDFLMISRLKSPNIAVSQEQRDRLDAVFAFLDVGPRSRLERMLVDEARARYPEASGDFWQQENLHRAVAAHAEDMDRAMTSVFISHAETLAPALAAPEALAHRERWMRMRAVLDAQGDALVAELVNHARTVAAARAPALSGR